MRAPTTRRQAGLHIASRELAETKPAEPSQHVTAEDLCRTDEFHNRLAEARIKRRKALAARLAAADKIPRRRFTPMVTETCRVADNDTEDASDAAQLEDALAAGPAPLPVFVHRPPASHATGEVETPLKQADLRAFASSVAPMAPPIPSEIELSEDAAARKRLGAAMALNAMPERPLEPGLVPIVSPAMLAGLQLRHVVPALLGLGAVAIASWFAPGEQETPGQFDTATVKDPTKHAVPAEPIPTLARPTDSIVPPQVLTLALSKTALPAPKVDTAQTALDGVPMADYLHAPGAALATPTALALAANVDARGVPGPSSVTQADNTTQPTTEAVLAKAPASPRPKARPETAVAVASGSSNGVGIAEPTHIALRLSDGGAPSNAVVDASEPATPAPAGPVLTGAQSGASAARPLILHVPDGPARSRLDDHLAQVTALITPHVEPRTVPFDISDSHVRVYHADDMAAAEKMAQLLGIRLLDKTSFEPRPSPGLIELWWAGSVDPGKAQIRSARALPQVLDEAQVSLETSIVGAEGAALPTRSAWVPAARLTPRTAAGQPGPLPTTGEVPETATAAPVVLNPDQSKGLRRLFRGLSGANRQPIE